MKPTLTAFLLAAILFPVAALAQDTPPAAPASAPRLDRSCNASNTCQTETIYLTSVGTQSDANEILVALRNILPPWIKVFLVSSNNAIVLQASASELALAHKIIHDLDRPKKPTASPTPSPTLTVTSASAASTSPSSSTKASAPPSSRAARFLSPPATTTKRTPPGASRPSSPISTSA